MTGKGIVAVVYWALQALATGVKAAQVARALRDTTGRMVEEDRDPTEQEWAGLIADATDQHHQIQDLRPDSNA